MTLTRSVLPGKPALTADANAPAVMGVCQVEQVPVLASITAGVSVRSVVDAVAGVLGFSSPPKVRRPVVQMVPVEMADFAAIGSRSVERFAHQDVDTLWPAAGDVHAQISASPEGPKNARSPADKGTNSAVVTDLVSARFARYGPPYSQLTHSAQPSITK